MQFNSAATGLVYNHRLSFASSLMHAYSNPLQAIVQLNYEKKTERKGIGGFLMYDQFGYYKNPTLGIKWSYIIFNKEKLKLSLGTSIETGFLHLDGSMFNADDPNVPETYIFNLSGGNNSGIWLATNKLNAGISIYNNYTLKIKHWNINHQKLVYLFTHYKLFEWTNISLSPEILLISDLSTYNIQTNLWCKFLSSYEVGIGYGHSNSFKFSLGYNWKKLNIDFFHRFNLIDSQTLFNQSAIQLAYHFN